MNLTDYKIIDDGYDAFAKSNYNMYAIPYNDLKVIARNWYTDIDTETFDSDKMYNIDINKVNKLSGIVSNLFFAYHENDKYYLLDGFKRLLSTRGEIDSIDTVYLKVYVDKLTEVELNTLLYLFNQWKIPNTTMYHSVIDNMFDRGIRLFYKVKFNIDFYTSENYTQRKRNNDDIKLIENYFKYENEMYEGYNLNTNIIRIMSNDCFISDIRHIIDINNYLIPPFCNYNMFIKGYCKFISNERIHGNTNELNSNFFIDELKKDKALYKKLINMSGTDSTRKNIYKFFKKYESK